MNLFTKQIDSHRLMAIRKQWQRDKLEVLD